jgi:DNA-binding NarL/FixJ family response regulator
MVVNGIRAMLNESRYRFGGHTATCQGTLELLDAYRTENVVLILDLNLRNEDGFAVLAAVKESYPTASVIVYTSYDDAGLITIAKKMGAQAFVNKEVASTMLLNTIDHVAVNKEFIAVLAPEKSEAIYNDHFEEKKRLTQREIELIQLIVAGKHTPDIAKQLFLSEHTVNTHRKNILKKLNLGSVADLVRFAFEHGLVDKNRHSQ